MDGRKMLEFDIHAARHRPAHAAALAEAVEHEAGPGRYEAVADQDELPACVAADGQAAAPPITMAMPGQLR